MFKTTTNNLDERQEQALLKIEHNGCWLAFWGLLIALLVQQVAFGADLSRVAGEWAVFMGLAVYMGFACLREGIWDRSLRPDTKTNAAISCIAALVMGVLMAIQVYAGHPDKPIGSVAAGVFSAMMTGTLCFALLSASAAIYRKRVNDLESELDDEE